MPHSGTDRSRPKSAPNLRTPSASTPMRTKRKRLVKACNSCHKSKRRCDGTQPCANCEFAGKKCVYTDASGRIVPPPNPTKNSRSTDASGVPGSSDGAQPGWMDSPRLSDGATSSFLTLSRPPPPVPTFVENNRTPQFSRRESLGTYPDDEISSNFLKRESPTRPLEHRNTHAATFHGDLGVDPSLCRDLINLFFTHIHPFNVIFHRPTFMTDIADGKVPTYLLNAIYALAAPLSAHPSLRVAGSLDSHSRFAGERFASAASAVVLNSEGQIVCERTLECAQALCCLSLQQVIARRSDRRPSSYLRLAMTVLHELGAPDWEDEESFAQTNLVSSLARSDNAIASTSTTSVESNELWKRKECQRRTLWVVHFCNLLAGAFTQNHLPYDADKVRTHLPMDEALFDLNITTGSTPEYVTIPTTSNQKSNTVSEFGHLMRITVIYARSMAHWSDCIALLRDSGMTMDPERSRAIFQSCESSLHAWEASLPSHLRFNDDNLTTQMASLDLRTNNGAYSYAFMHALAECCVLALHNSLETENKMDAVQTHASRRDRAYENLIIVLQRLGPSGRSNIMICSLYIHLAPSYNYDPMGGAPTPPYHQDVKDWFTEYESRWGVSAEQLLSVNFRSGWAFDALSASPFSSREASQDASPPHSDNLVNQISSPEYLPLLSQPPTVEHSFPSRQYADFPTEPISHTLPNDSPLHRSPSMSSLDVIATGTQTYSLTRLQLPQLMSERDQVYWNGTRSSTNGVDGADAGREHQMATHGAGTLDQTDFTRTSFPRRGPAGMPWLDMNGPRGDGE